MALAVDQKTGRLYVDHGGDVAVYDPSGTQVDSLSLGATTNSQGLAFAALQGGVKAGQGNLYVSDASNNDVTIFGPPPPGPPFVTAESETGTGPTTATLHATIVPAGFDTTCIFQYVDSVTFQASGYTNATTVPCTPADLGSSFDYQQASADVSGLTVGTFYHFHAVATNSAGTTTGADKTFQAGPGLWTPYFRCPVDDPAMLATDGVNLLSSCVASNSTHGSITPPRLPPRRAPRPPRPAPRAPRWARPAAHSPSSHVGLAGWGLGLRPASTLPPGAPWSPRRSMTPPAACRRQTAVSRPIRRTGYPGEPLRVRHPRPTARSGHSSRIRPRRRRRSPPWARPWDLAARARRGDAAWTHDGLAQHPVGMYLPDFARTAA